MENKKKILLVDDDILFRQLMETVLEDDFDISVAENGEEGYKLIQALAPDLILLDIDMPKMDGLEFVKRMSLDSKLKYIPTIVLTGGEDYNPHTNAMFKKEKNVKAFMSKLSSSSDILEKIKEIL
ncbi:MAG: response regulator [Elusimicrobiales bacterium]|nr:response regulator [Elusimicrobiales bacterium]MCK5106895.1 response regulator [Elusimicrobiales bacterium]